MNNKICPMKLPEKPMAPPPEIVPSYSPDMNFIIDDILEQCLYHYIFVWLVDEDSFWMFPVSFNDHTISGYIWVEEVWTYADFNWRSIKGFY
ncbi:MAG: hypothetical protein ACOX4U_04900 [Anaerovoracaceae bacterium]